jgi:hypothetical protein
MGINLLTNNSNSKIRYFFILSHFIFYPTIKLINL